MKNNWNKILNELSYRVSTGIPDLSNEQHLIKLWDILKEHKWPVDARVELLKNLNELDFKDKAALQKYASKHEIKPDTKVTVGDKETTAGEELPDLEKEKDDEQGEEQTDTLSDEKREELTQKDIELVETQLFLFEGDPQDAGGLGTPQSRTGECVTTYAGRRIKELIPPKGKMSYADAREQVKQELLKQANKKIPKLDANGKPVMKKGKPVMKKSLLTKEWVNSGLQCLDWIEENIKLENVEDFAWDTPEGNDLVGAKGHGTSADMFVKTTDGKVIGISLKKDFKVFVYNGGYDKNIKQFAKDTGIELPENTKKEWYDKNKDKIFGDRVGKFNDPEVKKKVCANFERAKKGGDDYSAVFGSRTKENQKRLTTIANLSGKENIKDVSCDDMYKNVINRKSHNTDSKTIVTSFAQYDKDIEKGTDNLYSNMRSMDVKLRDNLFDMLQKPENSKKFKEKVSKETHIDDILFGTEEGKIDRLEVIYGEPPKGESMKKNALTQMFGISDDYKAYENEKDPDKKKALKKKIQEKINENMVITKDRGKPVIGVKIKNPTPPPEESISPLFTLGVRAKGIIASPALEMGQSLFGGLAFKNGNVNIDTWPDTDKKKYIDGEAGSILDDIDSEQVDVNNKKQVAVYLNELKRLEALQRDSKSKSKKLQTAIERLKQYLGEV
ncbi:hypothetical protein N8469_00130 [bacterium]|nr:hypothetical protein [bacterium]